MTSNTPNELRDFLKTCKLHNKDLGACFNDALAVAHLESLIQKEVKRARLDEKETILKLVKPFIKEEFLEELDPPIERSK